MSGLVPIPISTEELCTLIGDMGQHVLDRDSFTGSIEYDCISGPPCSQCGGSGIFVPGDDWADDTPCRRCAGMGDEPLPDGKDFWVRGVYRIGNSEGQGGVRMIGEVPK